MCGAPRQAASAAARTSRRLTSGSACGPHSSRWPATMSASARGGQQRARRLAVQALALGPRQVRGDRGGDQAVGEALAAGGEQAGGQQRVARRAQLADRDARRRRRRRAAARRRRSRRAPRPPRGRAAPAPPAAAARRRARWRSRAVRRRRRRRSPPGRARRSGGRARPAATGCRRPRGGSRGTRRPACPGASRRISCVAPRGVSGCGCSTVADAHAAEQAQQVRRASGSSARAPTTISSGRSSIRRAR